MSSSERSVDSLLGLIRDQLQMDVAFLSVIRQGRRTFRSVSAGVASAMVVPVVGDWDRYEESCCRLIIDGLVPQVVPDTADEPLLAPFPAFADGHVGAYVAVPVTDAHGELYGSLCAFSYRSNPDLQPADSHILSTLAGVLYDLVIAEDDEARTRAQTREQVHSLISGDGLILHAQPIVSLSGSRPDGGAEILSRFTVEGSAVAPDEMFKRAHRAGVGNALEVEVFKRALAVRIDRAQPVAINMSASAIMSRAFERAVEALDLRQLSMVTVELTEHEAVLDYRGLLDRLGPLRDRGLLVAVDDLGAGFSSMRHAVDLAADIVKIDRQLISGLHLEPRQRAIVAGIMTFAARTGTRVIAEGIETRSELEAVQDLGVPWGQGYLLGRPAPLTLDKPASAVTPPQTGANTALLGRLWGTVPVAV